MSLHGTELVVLSSCNTGFGDVQLDETVQCLRRAFLLAGARSVVASLWPVQDEGMALLMSHFYAEYQEGRDSVEALRQAKLVVLKDLRSKQGDPRPDIWSGVTAIQSPGY